LGEDGKRTYALMIYDLNNDCETVFVYTVGEEDDPADFD